MKGMEFGIIWPLIIKQKTKRKTMLITKNKLINLFQRERGKQTLVSSVWPSARAPKLMTSNKPDLLPLWCKRLLFCDSMPCKPEIAATFVPLPLPKTPLKQKMETTKSNLLPKSGLMLLFYKYFSRLLVLTVVMFALDSSRVCDFQQYQCME